MTRLRPAVRRLVKTRVSAWALSIPHVRLSSHTPAGRKQLTHSRVEAAGRDRWGLWYFWRRYLPESIPTWLHGGAAEHVGPKPRTCSPCGGGGTRGGGQAGGRVTRSGCSPDSLQPGRVGAQRHAEAAAEPDAAVRGDQLLQSLDRDSFHYHTLEETKQVTAAHSPSRERAGASAHGGGRRTARAAGTLWTQPPAVPAEGAWL